MTAQDTPRRSSAQRIRDYSGPAVLSFGFRPFFLAGALWSALAVAIWIGVLSGFWSVPTAFSPVDWHIHEMIYGFFPAIAAGFLLTAVPNWTGRLPIVGLPLLYLFLLWLAGRATVFLSAWYPPAIAVVADLMFLAVLGWVIGREIVAAKKLKNLTVLAGVALLLTGNALFHMEAASGSSGGYGARLGIATAIMLIMLIGGRIVPSFTRNWLAKRSSRVLPSPFGTIDVAALVTGVAALACWVVTPDGAATLVLSAVAAVVHIVRLSRWAGHMTLAEPLVTILHAGYLFVPLGFALLAGSIYDPQTFTPSAALHAWSAGAVGLMTLAVMTRASLGHAGRELTASGPVILIYLAIILAAVLRILAALDSASGMWLELSALGWVLAYIGFAMIFAPVLLARRT